MIQIIKRLFFAFKFKRAIRKAKKFHELTGFKYYVIMLNGRLYVVPKKTIKELITKHRFRKGTNIQDIERHALFVTI